MINWIIGGIIAVAVVSVIVRTIIKMRKGGTCYCSNCSQAPYCSKAKVK